MQISFAVNSASPGFAPVGSTKPLIENSIFSPWSGTHGCGRAT